MALGSIEQITERKRSPILFINQNDVRFLASQILSYHRVLADVDNIESPYFNFTRGEGEMYHSEYLVSGLRLRVGNIKAFLPEEVGCFLENAIENYKEKGTMGDFPQGKPMDINQLHAEIELTKAFIEGFNHEKEWAAIMVDKKLRSGETTIIGGCLVSIGISHKPLREIVGSPEASIPTLSCLSFGFENNEELGETPEENVASVNRLFTISRDQTRNIGLSEDEKKFLLPCLISNIDVAVRGLASERNKSIKFGIADVSHTGLLRVVNAYNWNLITDDTRPTELVKGSILKYHYVFFTDIDLKTGKQRKIYAIYKKY